MNYDTTLNIKTVYGCVTIKFVPKGTELVNGIFESFDVPLDYAGTAEEYYPYSQYPDKYNESYYEAEIIEGTGRYSERGNSHADALANLLCSRARVKAYEAIDEIRDAEYDGDKEIPENWV